MNIREAMLKTAALFEARPELYNYGSCEVPECESPGCMIGWILHFAGIKRIKRDIGETMWETSRRILGFDYEDLCNFGNELGFGRVVIDAGEAARTIRAYANAHFPAKPVQQPPNWTAMASGSVPADAVSQEIA